MYTVFNTVNPLVINGTVIVIRVDFIAMVYTVECRLENIINVMRMNGMCT